MADCQGPRYLQNYNGSGFAYAAQFASGSLVYTRLVDPSYTVSLAIESFETMADGQDLSTPGQCLNTRAFGSIGEAVIAPAGELNTLSAPLRIE